MNITKYKQGGFSHILIPIAIMVLVGGVGAFFVVRSHAYTPCVHRIISVGSQGNCVKDAQTLLNAMTEHKGWGGNGYKGGAYLVTDGIYGANTKKQVIVFQTFWNSISSHSKIAVDGAMGIDTWGTLCGDTYQNNLVGSWATKAQPAGKDAGCGTL